MGLEAWLIGGVTTDDHITAEFPSCWVRSDLVDVPAMIQYEEDAPEDGIRVFSNNVGGTIVLLRYGVFEDFNAMMADYRASGNTLYKTAYAGAVTGVNAVCGTQLGDLDWIMPIVQGDLIIAPDYCAVPSFEGETKELVSIIDCCMIYTTVKMISSFISAFCSKTGLTKFEQYQLTYYQMLLQEIESPSSFLTNKAEIDIYTQCYDTWAIGSAIERASGNARQAMMLFSFLSEYKAAHNNELFSSFLTFFGIIVGLEAIYNLSVALMGGATAAFNLAYIVGIALLLVVYFIVLARRIIRHRAEDREYREKTARRRKPSGTP